MDCTYCIPLLGDAFTPMLFSVHNRDKITVVRDIQRLSRACFNTLMMRFFRKILYNKTRVLHTFLAYPSAQK